MHETAIFHFRSKIWRQHRVPRPRFPKSRENFGDSRTFKADKDYLICAWVFRTSLPKMGVLKGKIGKGWCDIDPKGTRSYFSGFLRLCQFWGKSIKKCDRESARSRTDTHINRHKPIFTALHVMQTRYSDENSVRLSVCPSVTRVHCDKTEERSVHIFTPYERYFSLVYWE